MVPACKPEDLSFIPGIQMVEEEERDLQVVF